MCVPSPLSHLLQDLLSAKGTSRVAVHSEQVFVFLSTLGLVASFVFMCVFDRVRYMSGYRYSSGRSKDLRQLLQSEAQSTYKNKTSWAKWETLALVARLMELAQSESAKKITTEAQWLKLFNEPWEPSQNETTTEFLSSCLVCFVFRRYVGSFGGPHSLQWFARTDSRLTHIPSDLSFVRRCPDLRPRVSIGRIINLIPVSSV